MECFVAKTNDGLFVAIDQSSGGYPWYTEYLASAKIWTDLAELKRYFKMFPTWQGRGPLTIHKLIVSGPLAIEG